MSIQQKFTRHEAIPMILSFLGHQLPNLPGILPKHPRSSISYQSLPGVFLLVSSPWCLVAIPMIICTQYTLELLLFRSFLDTAIRNMGLWVACRYSISINIYPRQRDQPARHTSHFIYLIDRLSLASLAYIACLGIVSKSTQYSVSFRRNGMMRRPRVGHNIPYSFRLVGSRDVNY